MFTEIQPILDGLDNLTLARTKVKQGISGADLMVLKAALRRRVKRGETERRATHGHQLFIWNDRLVDTVIASMEFCYEYAHPRNTPHPHAGDHCLLKHVLYTLLPAGNYFASVTLPHLTKRNSTKTSASRGKLSLTLLLWKDTGRR